MEEPSPTGAYYRCRKPTPLGHRVGSVAIAHACTADPQLLALLALDGSLTDFDPKRALYLDTETTGLAGGTGTVPFLLGLGFFDEDVGGFVVEQVLLRTFAEEAAMVEHLRRRVEASSALVTFNGKSFDWPLLKTRATMNRLAPLPERPHLDLLHIARRLHKHRVTSCALGRVEDEILGQARVDDVAGADIAAIYHHYVRTGDLCALEPVVQHNTLDVVSMFALVSLYGEPIDAWAKSLDPTDIAAASAVARRAKDFDRALTFAEVSVERGAGAYGHRARGDVSKARGDKAAALADYERALAAFEVPPARETFVRQRVDYDDDSVPPRLATHERIDTFESLAACAVRLELAKLYEHHARAFDKALAALSRGTTEDSTRHARRMRRLSTKLESVDSPTNASPKKRRALVRKKAVDRGDASKASKTKTAG